MDGRARAKPKYTPMEEAEFRAFGPSWRNHEDTWANRFPNQADKRLPGDAVWRRRVEEDESFAAYVGKTRKPILCHRMQKTRATPLASAVPDCQTPSSQDADV